MAVSGQASRYAGEAILQGAMSLAAPPGNGLKLALLTAIPAFVLTDFLYERYFDNTYEISSSGYTAGGHAIAGPAYIYTETFPPIFSALTGNVDFLLITASPKYAVLYCDATIDSIVQPLICAYDLEDTGGSLSLVNETLSINPSNGFVKLSVT